MGTKNDKIILKLKEDIEVKKALLKQGEKFSPLTNCSLELRGTRTNLHVASKQQLLLLIAELTALQSSLKTVLPQEKLEVSGYSVDEWLKDLTSKFASLNISLERERLKSLEAKLHNLLSVDTKVGLEIEDLQKQI